jgi:predicted DNA-binding transcriptional regulator AlpA
MSPDLAVGLRALAAALPAGTAVPVPREMLLELLEAIPHHGAELPSANGTGTPNEQLLTVQEVATRFGLTTDWLYRHWKAVGGVKLGRKVLRFPASDIARYLAAQRKAP